MPEMISAATGRRKTAVARVQLSSGTGTWEINHRPVEEYFPTEALRTYMGQPLKWDYVWAGLCVLGAVYFVFRG